MWQGTAGGLWGLSNTITECRTPQPSLDLIIYLSQDKPPLVQFTAHSLGSVLAPADWPRLRRTGSPHHRSSALSHSYTCSRITCFSIPRPSKHTRSRCSPCTGHGCPYSPNEVVETPGQVTCQVLHRWVALSANPHSNGRVATSAGLSPGVVTYWCASVSAIVTCCQDEM